MRKLIFTSILIFLLGAGCRNSPIPVKPSAANNPSAPVPSPSAGTAPSLSSAVIPAAQLYPPISNALSRITKKPFGIFITPKTSPVQPERFTGFHTGVDFETTPAEQNIDVPIFAACDGKLLLKKYASGYGGVAVQSCKLDGADVTIVYGHLRLSSIIPNVGDVLKAGDKLAVLGTGYSSETDGERKHLHFGIHKGTAINILGYVQKQSDLSGWLDAAKYLK